MVASDDTLPWWLSPVKRKETKTSVDSFQKHWQSKNLTRTVFRDSLGTLFFEMVIFPYQHHGCLGVRKLRVFFTSDSLISYSVESNT